MSYAPSFTIAGEIVSQTYKQAEPNVVELEGSSMKPVVWVVPWAY